MIGFARKRSSLIPPASPEDRPLPGRRLLGRDLEVVVRDDAYGGDSGDVLCVVVKGHREAVISFSGPSARGRRSSPLRPSRDVAPRSSFRMYVQERGVRESSRGPVPGGGRGGPWTSVCALCFPALVGLG